MRALQFFEDQSLDELSHSIKVRNLMKSWHVRNWTVNDGRIDVDGIVRIPNGVNELPVQFGTINNSFICSETMTTLIHGPLVVNGSFACSGSKVVDLQYSPMSISDSYLATDCMSLKSLKGVTKSKTLRYVFNGCHALESLEGLPDEVESLFIKDNYLPNLTGSPKIITDEFDCAWSRTITDLKGGPEEVRGIFSCRNCENLVSLEGAPLVIGGLFTENLPLDAYGYRHLLFSQILGIVATGYTDLNKLLMSWQQIDKEERPKKIWEYMSDLKGMKLQ